MPTRVFYSKHDAFKSSFKSRTALKLASHRADAVHTRLALHSHVCVREWEGLGPRHLPSTVSGVAGTVSDVSHEFRSRESAQESVPESGKPGRARFDPFRFEFFTTEQKFALSARFGNAATLLHLFSDFEVVSGFCAVELRHKRFFVLQRRSFEFARRSVGFLHVALIGLFPSGSEVNVERPRFPPKRRVAVRLAFCAPDLFQHCVLYLFGSEQQIRSVSGSVEALVGVWTSEVDPQAGAVADTQLSLKQGREDFLVLALDLFGEPL